MRFIHNSSFDPLSHVASGGSAGGAGRKEEISAKDHMQGGIVAMYVHLSPHFQKPLLLAGGYHCVDPWCNRGGRLGLPM